MKLLQMFIGILSSKSMKCGGVNESFWTLVQMPPLIEDIECIYVTEQKLELQVSLMFNLHPPFWTLCARTHLRIQCSIAL